ncbi:hypothetical protein GCM10011507_28200 [Edaphobacter acidisoli]|uniref:6-phosphogluconolactonase (Cycloisomerase 2 family) n=1 Tax=Edaphobacter acidisoli TaxID=2040573 RepID=A0A916RZI4_9BACT|nr:beta-propeller fold lactonase family protein [Edaphobacter acidisoli]GGA75167.1 hypothetical protein GCM10011507_28200 [Edaphobacter acidisoli]
MKLNKLGRGALASIVSVALGLGLTACSRDYVLSYVYVTNAKPASAGATNGAVTAYAVDYLQGTLTPLPDSPIAAGKNPVTDVATPNGQTLYVINHDDSTVMQFSIGTDGKLYLKNTVNITGSFPTAAAVDATGTFLYVTFTYQVGPNNTQLYSPASPGPGGVTVFKIGSDGSLTPQSTTNVGMNPIAIAISRPVCATINTGGASATNCELTGATSNNGYYNTFVYVVDQEPQPNATVLGFTQNTSTGALTPAPGTTITTVAGKTVATGYAAGVAPSAVAVDPSTRFVYVTDQLTNQLYGFNITTGGGLSTMVSSPFATGQFPVAVTIDPRGLYMYVANKNSGTISAYAIDAKSGSPSGTVGSTATTVGTQPTCIGIDPSLGIYTYVSNNLDASVSALQLNPHNGALTTIQNSPFPSSGLPTCLAVVAASNQHPTQFVVQ